jgi:lipoprotein-anchoring transpeptidase ErfK/SrfK
MVVAVQQRLVWLGAPIKVTKVMDRATLGAVARFRTKFGAGVGTNVTASVWSVLNSVSRAHGVLPAACRTGGLVLCVDKTQKSLRMVVNGKVVVTTDARFGSEALPTREGVFHVQRKDKTHVSTMYHTSMPYAMFFSGGQAVHYSPYFHRDGYSGHSHGCVNIRDIGVAATLFARSPIGTRVVVYRS